MKKILLNLFAIILAVSMVFTMAPLSMEHAYADDNTITVGGVIYTLNGDGTTATVSGHIDSLSGAVTIHSPISNNDQQYKVTSIKNFAFFECEDLTSITIPKDVTSVGGSAFETSGLTSVTFAEESKLTSIGGYAFAACKKLENITIPKDVTSVGGGAFETSGLTSVTFAEGSKLTSIGARSFAVCENLETITIPESVTSIEASAFTGCKSLKSIMIPKGVTSIEEGTFYGNAGLTSVTFAEESNLTSIEASAFWGCKSLESITMPESVTSIGERAFELCAKLETINIPVGVENIGNSAFSGCRSLSTVTIPANVESMGENAFHWCGLTTVVFEEGSNLTTIEKDMFSDCFSLTTVTIPASVKSIESNAFASAPLTTINFLGSEYQWNAITGDGKPTGDIVNFAKEYPASTTINGVVYVLNEDRTATVNGLDESIQSPDTVTIPQSVEYDNKEYRVTSVGENAFERSGLTSVTFEEGSNLISIGNIAFANCDSLETITLPGSLKSIGANAFYHCIKLESITLPDGLERIEWCAFSLTGLKSIEIPTSVTSIGAGAFSGSSGLTSVEFADGSAIKIIPTYMFQGCRNMGSIEIPASVTSIENNAFDGCEGLTSITIPDKVTSISEYTFKNCTNLKTVTIPASVTFIGEGAFQNVPLTTVNFGGTKAQWNAITGEGKPTGVTVNFAKEDTISIKGAGVALSATAFTYNGAVQKPAIVKIGSWKMAEGTDYTAAWSNAASKDIGTYSVTVTGKGKYKDSAAASYQIVPKGTTLKKPKKAKKAVTVKWKKQKSKMPKARISGYRIQLATDSAFTTNVKTVNVKGYKKTSKKVKKLKGKTMYYVRVCTYMKSGGNTYYSPWSAVKTVKTR